MPPATSTRLDCRERVVRGSVSAARMLPADKEVDVRRCLSGGARIVGSTTRATTCAARRDGGAERESNPCPPRWKRDALPLSYGPPGEARTVIIVPHSVKKNDA